MAWGTCAVSAAFRSAVVGCVVLGGGAAAFAQTADEFYRGRTVNLIVGFSIGGGYDIYARALARHLAKHIPGTPNIVVQNMPGAGSQKVIEYLLVPAPRDGLTVGTFSRTLLIAPLLEGAKYDPTKLEWVGSISTDTSTCIAWHESPIKTWDDMKSKPFTVGGLGKGSDPDLFANLVKTMFALPVKLVSGYPGTNDVALAMERREVDGICGFSFSSLRASRKAWLDERKVNILVQAALTKDAAIPASVPLLLDLAGNDTQKQALSLILAPQAMARPFAMPPGTPKDRVQAIRNAFQATMKDPEFIKDAEKTGLDVAPISGEAMTGMLQKLYGMPPDIIAEARRGVGN